MDRDANGRFAPGHQRIGGRKPGTPNKVSRDVRELILEALSGVGGSAYLARQAEGNPTAFLNLVRKLVPTQLTGKDDGPIMHEMIVTEIVDSKR